MAVTCIASAPSIPQRALDHISSTLPKCEVVLSAVTLVTVAFNAQLETWMFTQKLSMRLYHIM
jgi:hypothetical protein